MIIVTRELARLRAPRRRLGRMEVVRGIVVHCTEGRRPKSEADARAAWRASQAYHQAPPNWVEVTDEKGKTKRVNKGGRGWPDIAYQAGFNDLGMVLRGRPDDRTGAHTVGHNAKALGFVWQGKAREEPAQAAYEALAWLIDEADQRHGPGLYVIGHRDVSSKSCPGDALYAHLVERYGDRNPHRSC
jgi:hypothetical protein